MSGIDVKFTGLYQLLARGRIFVIEILNLDIKVMNTISQIKKYLDGNKSVFVR